MPEVVDCVALRPFAAELALSFLIDELGAVKSHDVEAMKIGT